ncbi:MAG: hypothetical protein EOP14_06560, partial [Pseudomonas sp.]
MAAWEPMPAQRINFVPFAFEAKQIAGFNAQSLLKFNFPLASTKNLSPLSEAEYDKVIALIAGNSGDYEKPGRLNNVVVPTFGAGDNGKVLGWNGSAWTVSDSVPADSITTTKIIDGTITGADLATNVTINTSGGITTTGAVTSNISSTNISTSRDFRIYDTDVAPNDNYVSIKTPASLSQNYNFTWPLNYGTSGQVLTTDGAGVLTWAAAAAASQWSNGTAGAVYYNGGNVGIGTATPQAALDVGSGNIVTSGLITYPGAVAGLSFDTAGFPAFAGNSGTSVRLVLANTNTSNGTSSVIMMKNGAVDGSRISSLTTSSGNMDLIFDTRGGNVLSESMRIKSDGNVGIGTNAPSFKLDVVGDISSSAQVYASQLGLSNSGAYRGSIAAIPFGAQDGGLKFSTRTSGTVSEKMRIDQLGNVAIGSTAPNGKLDVSGSVVMSGATSGYVGFKPAAAAGSTIWELPAVDGGVDQ